MNMDLMKLATETLKLRVVRKEVEKAGHLDLTTEFRRFTKKEDKKTWKTVTLKLDMPFKDLCNLCTKVILSHSRESFSAHQH